MSIDRRDFLKSLGGICAAVGLSAAAGAVVPGRLEASSGGTALEDATAGSAVRWGMAINTRLFTSDADFDRCQEACHSIHNVPNFGNIKDEIKWCWKATYHEAYPSKAAQFLPEGADERGALVMCNHCENPPCVRACPTKATFKAANGITMMDMHRCIGCRFCMAACPFGARSFNWRNPRVSPTELYGGRQITPEFPTRERGVVEKCNFCQERIASGPVPMKGEELSEAQMPACVLAAPKGALTFGNLKDPSSKVRQMLNENHSITRKSEAGTNPSIFYIL